MTVSAWGVDHGVEISKAKDHAKRQAGYTAGAQVLGLGVPVAATRAGVKAKKGRKAANVGRTFGRTMAEGTAGGAAGALLTRGNPLATTAGSMAGVTHGAYAAGRNAVKRGDIKGTKSR